MKQANPRVKVLSLGWLGVRTGQSSDMSAFYRDVLGLEPIQQGGKGDRFRLHDGTEAHVYPGDDSDHAFFGDGPVVGFAVASFAAARAALVSAGVEFIYREPQRQAGRAWQHFRAPDGNIYEIIGPDDLEQKPNLRVKEMMTFVPSGSDYELSLRFYQDLGFQADWKSDELAILRIESFRFFLQKFENREMQGNFMMNLEVENVDDWWKNLAGLKLQEKYPAVKLKPPELYPWGKKEIHLIDPAGILWHIASRA
jgi:catechol 2,3-dioxygenase-like lactoylglutathione lyase family enzyme